MSRLALARIFPDVKPIVGVVHLAPLPGSPRWRAPLESVIARALEDAAAMCAGGVDGLIVENYGDVPFVPGSVGPETVAAMAVLVGEVSRSVDVPVGVNVLRSDAPAALAVAVATGARFIRVNVHTGATVTDQGVIQGSAHETLRARARLDARDIAILADVHVKHGRPLAGGDIHEEARDAVERGLADGILVTGASTGGAADLEDVRAVRAAVPDSPVLVASGVTAAMVAETLALADGLIVATAFESLDRGERRMDADRIRAFMAAAGRA